MRRLATPRAALALGALQLVLIAGGLVAGQLAHTFLQSLGVGVTVFLAFSVVGTTVAHRRPELPTGWMMLGVSGLLGLSALGVSYSVLDYRLHGGRLPLGLLAALIEPSWLPSFVLLVYTIVLYPAGRAPSRRWRWPLRILGGFTALWVLAVSSLVTHFVLRGHVRVLPGGDLYQTDHATGVWAAGSSLTVLVLAGSALLLIAWFVRQGISFGGSTASSAHSRSGSSPVRSCRCWV
jgi:hypothetical protein